VRPRFHPGDLALARWGRLVLLVALVLRLFNAGGKSLWFDEIVTLAVPAQPAGRLLATATIPGTNTPPLFPVLYKIWMVAGSSDGWLRDGTALFGAGIVLCTWLVARRLFGLSTAVLATTLVAFSAYQVTYSQYVRMYGLLAFTGMLSLYCLLRAADGGHPRWWAWWSLAGAACLYSFYYAGFLLAGEGIWVLWEARRRRVLLRPALIAMTVMALLYVPWLPSMLHQIHDGGSRAWMARPTLETLQYTLEQFFFLDANQTALRLGLAPVVLLIGLGALLPRDNAERLLLGLFTGCGIVLPFLASQVVQPFYDPRYLVYGAAGLSIFAARGLSELVIPARWYLSNKHHARVVIAASGLLVLFSAGPLGTYYTAPVPYRPDIRGAVAAILRQYRPGDEVVYDDPVEYLPGIWYAHQLAGSGTASSGRLYPWMPDNWVHNVPMHQEIVGPETIGTTHWWPRAGRLWLVTTYNGLTRTHLPRFDPWFVPPTGWTLVSTSTRYYRIYLRLYARS
jgi:4-amino-4-deoxy-L-arabinose transferase-like glycosyltransferase